MSVETERRSSLLGWTLSWDLDCCWDCREYVRWSSLTPSGSKKPISTCEPPVRVLVRGWCCDGVTGEEGALWFSEA